jgi:hypothetical protein
MPNPTPYDVAHAAHAAVLSTMKPVNGSLTGSLKSGPGEWFDKDVEKDPCYHHMRAIRHLTSGRNISVGTEVGVETPIEHYQRAVTRATFCLMVEIEKAERGD